MIIISLKCRNEISHSTMTTWTFLLLLCGQALAQGAARVPCCVNSKFNGLMMRIQATLPVGATSPVITDVYSHLDYDADLQQERIQGSILDGNTGVRTNYTQYKDFKHSKSYMVTASGCTESPLHEVMIEVCIAANLTFERQYTLGSGLTVTAWEGPYLGTLWVNIHFIDSTCAPLAVHIYGQSPDGSSLLYSYQFADVQLGKLSDANPFLLPDSCRQGAQAVG